MKKWPAWFPYPSSYLRAISLFPFVFTTFLFSVGFFLEVSGLRGDAEAISPALLIAFFGSISPIICMTLHTLFHHKVVRRFKGWWPTPLSWWLGFYATVTVNIAIILTTFVFADAPYYRNNLIQELLTNASMIFFLAIATILFQIEFLIRRRFFPNYITPIWKQKKSKKRSTKTKEERVDAEIVEILKEMKGLKREANQLTDRE